MPTVLEAAEGGDRRALLVAMRARIASAVDDRNTLARDLAALTRRLMDVAKELEALDAAEAEDDVGAAIALDDEDFDPATL